MNENNATVAQLDRATAFILEPSGWKVEKLVSKGDYLYAVVKDHPLCTKHGYVLHHRIVMENHLKRLLTKDEVVHHIDGNRKNNSVENLQVLGAIAHCRHHGFEVGRLWVKLKCPVCSSVFHREKRTTFLRKPSKIKATCCSKSCGYKLGRMYQLNRITPEVERAISVNILLEYRKYSRDNAEETATTGSVETIRMSPETVKT